ncbi:MAG: CDP-alcohol phosphatidyltransferase family protein [Candidatus Rokubacteria bacterium]|nr:CDP-alcohol phosphatidyltransferase family protein [Candidatus Rokubacteria bacterium]
MAKVGGALVVASAPGALGVVGGLPLVVRAVLTLRAADIADVAVFAGPQDRRVAALLAGRCPGVPCFRSVEEAAALPWPDSVLVVPGDVLFDGATLAPLTAAATPGAFRVGHGPAASGVEVAAICPGGAVPALLAEVIRTPGLRADALRRVGAALDASVPLAEGLFISADRSHSPAALETALLDHLARRTTTKDSYLAALIDRRLSRPVTRLLLRSTITPSRITLASILLGLVGAAGLATVSYAGRVGGVLALIASIVLDCVDGEVARARWEQSPAGARLDVLGDYVVHLAVFVGLGVGLFRQGLAPAGVWAAVALVTGVAASMVTMHALFVRPALTHGGDLHWEGDGESLSGTPVATVVEKLASRDYTYVLLVFALLGRLEWFLYAAAGGAWAFVAGVLGYWGYQRLPPRRPAVSP